MRKFICIIVVLFATIPSFSQGLFSRNPILNKQDWDKQRVHWGYYLGFNSYNYKINYDQNYYEQLKQYQDTYKEQTPRDYSEIQVTSAIGFNVGLIGNLRLMEYLDLRFEPGLYYTKRTLHYPKAIFYHYFDKQYNNPNPTSREIDMASTKEVGSTYIHLPLLLKFSAKRTGNIRPYILGGFSSDLNLSSNSTSQEDNYEGVWRMKKWTFNYELGAGIDIYFQYFKFSPSIRGVFGLDNELIPDNNPNSPWTSGITSMKSRGVFINFTFH
ncbi:type IX secretion/gliding motility protein PorT/SprT [Myroides sp. LJL115]